MPQQNRIRMREQLKVFQRIILTIVALVLVMLGVMIFGSMDDEVSGVGNVEGIREYELKTLVSAKVTKVFHFPGEEVAPGEALLEFDARNQHDEITRLKNAVKELELNISVKEKALELLLKDPLPAYYRHTKNQLSEAKERLAKATTELDVYKKLYEQKVVTRRDFLKVELDHLTSRMAVARLEDDWKKLQDGMAKQIVEQAEEELRLLRHKLKGQRDELAMAERHLEDYVLRAPDAGIITDSPPRPGGYYEKGDTVIKFAANQRKKIIGLISEKQVFKVESGQRVRIYAKQYNYLDYGYFEGKVDYVCQLPILKDGINYYPVKILLIDEKQPLRFGSGCEVTIITGRERIIFALLGLRSKDYLKRRGLDKITVSKQKPKVDLKPAFKVKHKAGPKPAPVLKPAEQPAVGAKKK
ncbi:MAG: HlyD family efflux transporter periplasmic adaptor subunit [Lentisphaerae bacterium]|nr:HlyD family efflux transporter periplasmic adaptor subunit [Lentisphaerota bacterium]